MTKSSTFDAKQFPKTPKKKYSKLTAAVNEAFAEKYANVPIPGGGDRKFDEGKISRADDGKFGHGGGGAAPDAGGKGIQPKQGLQGLGQSKVASGSSAGPQVAGPQQPQPGEQPGQLPPGEGQPGAPARENPLTKGPQPEGSEQDTGQDTGQAEAPAYTPDVEAVGEDGVTTHARVGVGAYDVPPPPPIPRMPNLNEFERHAETAFAEAFEADPDKMAQDYTNTAAAKAAERGGPITFETDSAKTASSDWQDPPPEQRMVNRSMLNVALHQTANAIVKRAFVKHLDTLNEGDMVTVTVGGCGAGKGFCLDNVDDVKAIRDQSACVWDSAGDQNATENPWILAECEKRGLRANYVFVDADPENSWANPDFGVVKRADDPDDGRMVDAHVFADSYAIGNKNHDAFYQQNKNNKSALFAFIQGGVPKPHQIGGIPPKSLQHDRHALKNFASTVVKQRKGIPEHIKSGALAGGRYWGDR